MTHRLPITLSDSSAFDSSVDALFILTGKDPVVVNNIPHSHLQDAIREDFESKEFEGKFGQVAHYRGLNHFPATHLYLVGIGEASDADSTRKLGAQIIKLAIQKQHKSLSVVLPSTVFGFHHLVEGMELGMYKAPTFARDAKTPHAFEKITIYGVSVNLASQYALNKQQIIDEAVCYARDLINKPGNLLVPEDLAKEAEQLGFQHSHLRVRVLREDELESMGMGAILAVGKGSVNKPRMIAIHYMGDPDSSEVLGLVGKGITFDTGGISIKPANRMENMIGDMGGAAAVLGTMRAVAQLHPKKNIIAVIPTAENMPSSNAYKPGDVITSYSKRTIEIVNTDAEGRVILADAITYAKELGVTKMIDIATLTGAILVCLGNELTGVVTNNDDFYREFEDVTNKTHELIHRLPVVQAFRDMIKSPVADVRNSTGGHPGSITAGLFLGTFAEDTPWIHLDIAGTSWLDRESGYLPKGGTGVMVRSFVELVLRDGITE